MSNGSARAGLIVRDLSQALRWSQRTLAVRSGLSQGYISRVERDRCPDVSIDTIDRLLGAMGARLTLGADTPFMVSAGQRDIVHAKCSAYVVRRLRHAGWQVSAEVEVGSDRSRGWIDVLAWHPGTGVLLVIEIKTELHDLGAIERSLGWYEREAWAAARRLGWRPRRVVGCLLLLMSDAVDRRILDNREAIAQRFPLRSGDLWEMVAAGARAPSGPLRGVALIDPRSRRQHWLRPARADGRRTAAPYRDYADFVRQEGRARSER
jgi:transcriptional regulator with XRE-family HTH domain